jgi:hypothetical protein
LISFRIFDFLNLGCMSGHHMVTATVTGEIVKSRFSRQPETCLDPKPTFNFMRDERPCVVSKIEVDTVEVDAEKKESVLNRVVEYALRLVA